MKIRTVGVDLAKTIMQIHGVDERGRVVVRKQLKRGDTYLRTLLIHGARAVIRVTERKVDQTDSWLVRLIDRRNRNVAAVALANKNARRVWALLAHDRKYQFDYLPAVAAV
jgi:transposase